MKTIETGKYINITATGNPYLSLNQLIRITSKRANLEVLHIVDCFSLNYSIDSITNEIGIDRTFTGEIVEVVEKGALAGRKFTEVGVIVKVNKNGTYDVNIKSRILNKRNVPTIDSKVYSVNDRVMIDYIDGNRYKPIIVGLVSSAGGDETITVEVNTLRELGILAPTAEARIIRNNVYFKLQ